MSVENDFRRAGFHQIVDATYPGTYEFITLENLFSKQCFNRGAKRWTKAECCILEIPFSDDSEKKRALSNWATVAKFKDQTLFVKEIDDTYTAYDYNGTVICNGMISELLKVIKMDLTPVILYGPPGTGKTFSLQQQYYNCFKDPNRFFVTFHQSYSYEDFVIGIKPILSSVTSGPSSTPSSGSISYALQKGVFYDACDQAAKLAGYNDLQDCISAQESDREKKIKDAVNNNKLVLFCIDEINRANVSAVFGDLIALIEVSKRLGAKNEMICKLPYKLNDKQISFGVPLNLVIVGAMNTADRSIQLLDSALRRRFKFKELLPNYSKITNPKAKKILEAINSRIRYLLDKDHQIGHTYFIECTDDFGVYNAIVDKIIPLLEEYFYNDIGKIRMVLNETNTSDDHYFYEKDTVDINPSSDYYDDDKTLFRLKNITDVKDDISAGKYIAHIILPYK